MTAALLLMVLACNRERGTQTATAPSKTSTGITIEQDLRKAKVSQVINTDPVEQTTESHLGKQAKPDGVVVQDATEFKAGEPIILSMVVRQSPGGLRMGAIWRDAKGNVLEEQRKTMNGALIATFAYDGKPLVPGSYSVTGYWGGDIAAEKKFKVTR